MTRGIEDDLTLAVGRTNLEKIVGDIVRLRRILGKSREVVVVFEDLIVVGNLAGAWTEGTPVLGHLWAILAVGVNHDPILDQGMPSQFSHGTYASSVISMPPHGRMVSRWQLSFPVIFSISAAKCAAISLGTKA